MYRARSYQLNGSRLLFLTLLEVQSISYYLFIKWDCKLLPSVKEWQTLCAACMQLFYVPIVVQPCSGMYVMILLAFRCLSRLLVFSAMMNWTSTDECSWTPDVITTDLWMTDIVITSPISMTVMYSRSSYSNTAYLRLVRRMWYRDVELWLKTPWHYPLGYLPINNYIFITAIWLIVSLE